MPDFSVLFVDDEPITRNMSGQLIGRHYPVLEATDGDHAVAILDSSSDQIGVVMTDMKMAGMDGPDLIEIIAKRYPQIPVIASTGDLSNYEFDALVASGKIVAAIEKPWDLGELFEIIGTAIAGRSGDAEVDRIL